MADTKAVIQSLRDAIHIGLVGQDSLVDGLLRALLSNGHVLIEGVPGLAKTRAVKLLSAACSGDFARVQFTPDLLPSDIIGTRIYDRNTGEFQTKQGPVFTNFLLADEINRAAPKVQSALLEAMQERQVTIGGETRELPRPFLVFATQNPVEQQGTYPLPEAQVDRFLCKLVVDYPTEAEESEIVKMVMNETRMPAVSPVLDLDGLLELQEYVRKVFVDDKIVEYATQIVRATRDLAGLDLGASPRASISLIQLARADAVLSGDRHVEPEHIKAVAPDVLRHRLLLNYQSEAEGATAEQFISTILSKLKVP